jgi:putative ABC transport system ATP-binding protein
MITVENLAKIVDTQEGPLQILTDINFEIAAGDTVAVTGESGSGKSTLLSLLAGLDRPTSGKVIIDGHEIQSMAEDDLAEFRAANVGFIFQSFHLLGSLTALENVMLPIELKGNSGAREQARALLDQVGLSHRLGHYPKQLSGGEQQRVAIARAFATQPKILFADEPTGNLDTKTGSHVSELLFQLNKDQKTTLILVTHDEGLAQACNQQIVLSAGQVVSHA